MSMSSTDTLTPSPRERAASLVESRRFQAVIITLIIINAITLGMETSDSVMASIGSLLLAFDDIVLAIFVAEISLKLFAYQWRFFRDPWNVFDFIIVAIALVPASGPLAVLRAMRILRVLRLVSMLPRLRFVVESLLRAVPGISAIAGLLFIIFYVFAVMATELFGDHHAEWFGTIGKSMYTLFQIMTLESWSMGIVRPVMETHPMAWLFFIPFILIATFTVLNLFIAIIVDAMQAIHNKTQEEETEAIDHCEQHIRTDISAMRDEIREIRRLLQQRDSSPGQGL
jgi:voltage-gated sodium channel